MTCVIYETLGKVSLLADMLSFCLDWRIMCVTFMVKQISIKKKTRKIKYRWNHWKIMFFILEIAFKAITNEDWQFEYMRKLWWTRSSDQENVWNWKGMFLKIFICCCCYTAVLLVFLGKGRTHEFWNQCPLSLSNLCRVIINTCARVTLVAERETCQRSLTKALRKYFIKKLCFFFLLVGHQIQGLAHACWSSILPLNYTPIPQKSFDYIFGSPIFSVNPSVLFQGSFRFHMAHKTSCHARCRWLMPVILVTWESEIGRITVWG
jgi:hypothetical protein